jgi:DNA (cytosine-5)-methyltransferase 1
VTTGTVFDLFCGAGGASLGIHAALSGADVIGVDLDLQACATHEAAGFKTVNADVSEMSPAEALGCEGMWASPPCTAYTLLGSRRGLGALEEVQEALRTWEVGATFPQEDPLIWLVAEPLRWAFTVQPAWVICEQVPSVLPIWRTIGARLAEVGYHVWSGILNAADYGVPQTRERACLLASRLAPVSPPTPTRTRHPHPRLDGTEERPWVTMASALGWDAHKGPRWCHERPATTIVGDARVYPPDGHHPDMQMGHASRRAVKITLAEMAVLQGFPAHYPFVGSKTAVARQIGNAVPPPLARACTHAVTGLQRGSEAML